VAEFRRKEIILLKEALGEIKALDDFQKAAVFVNWWEGVRYDLKAIVTVGWSTSLIPDEYVRKAFFEKELIEIESIEISIANIQEALASIVEDVDMDDEDERTAKAVKSYLKSQIDDLEEAGKDNAQKEAQKLEKILTSIKDKESKLKDTKRALKEKEAALEAKIEDKKKSFTEAEARTLILQKFFDGIRYQLERYLSAEEKKIASVLIKRWDKYQVPLSVIESDRDKSTKRMFRFLSELGYKK
jgi:type I restriction enzyme M protein